MSKTIPTIKSQGVSYPWNQMIHGMRKRPGAGRFILPVLVLVMGGIVSCHSGPSTSRSSKPAQTRVSHRPPQVDVETVNLTGGGWGYKIIVNGKLYIFQRQIPCIEGTYPFPDQRSAAGVAKITRQKIMNGQDPSVSMEELTGVIPSAVLDSIQGSR